ncbi:MAG: hypothetical protein ACR2RE_06305, partial [Geminicoccaceae bacterium]
GLAAQSGLQQRPAIDGHTLRQTYGNLGESGCKADDRGLTVNQADTGLALAAIAMRKLLLECQKTVLKHTTAGKRAFGSNRMTTARNHGGGSGDQDVFRTVEHQRFFTPSDSLTAPI